MTSIYVVIWISVCLYNKDNNKELTNRLKNKVLLPAGGVGGGDGGFRTVWEV